MELLKKSILAIVLLLMVAVVWVGSLIYFQSTSIDVDPNASSYTKQLKNSFDEDELSEITQRTEENFPVSPSEFLNLATD